MKQITFILILLFSSVTLYAQTDSTTFSNEQVLKISNTILDYKKTDSLQKELINELNYTISQFTKFTERDSILLDFKNQELALKDKKIDLYIDLYNQSKPKWYDRKGIQYVMGMGSILASSWVVNNTTKQL